MVKDCPPEGQRKPMPVSIPERASTRIDPQLFTPYPARIVAIHDETPDIRRYVVRYMDERLAETFRLTGQFFMVTVFGVGEVALSIPFGDQRQPDSVLRQESGQGDVGPGQALQRGDVI